MSYTILWALLTGLITCWAGLGIVLLLDRRRRAMEIAELRGRLEELERAQGRVVELERALENVKRRLPAELAPNRPAASPVHGPRNAER